MPINRSSGGRAILGSGLGAVAGAATTVATGAATAGLRAAAAGGAGHNVSANGVGWTVFNDPPPGAGGLNNSEYCFAELGTARRTDGQGTGVGNLAKALGLPGELPMGARVTFTMGSRRITAVKHDRGYGQGGDGIHSDPAYSVDFWDGTRYGGKNPAAALGLGGKGTGLRADYNGISTGAGGGSGAASGTATASGGASSGSTSILGVGADLFALFALTVVKDVAIGIGDYIVIPFWHWNQRAATHYREQILFDVKGHPQALPATAAFWGLGYILLFTDPNAKNLKPAPVRNSRLAHHVRRLQSLPARRSMVKPKDVKGKTPKKPPIVTSVARVSQTGTLQATRSSPVRISGTHRQSPTGNGTGSQARIEPAGTLPGAPRREAEIRRETPRREPNSEHRTRPNPLPHSRGNPPRRKR